MTPNEHSTTQLLKSVATEKDATDSIGLLIESAHRNAESVRAQIPTTVRLYVEGVPRHGSYDSQSGPSRSLVISIYWELCAFEGHRARTVQLSDALDYSDRQIQKACRWLESEQKIRHEKEGRNAYWVIEDTPPLTEKDMANLGTLKDRQKYLRDMNMAKFDKDSRYIPPDRD